MCSQEEEKTDTCRESCMKAEADIGGGGGGASTKQEGQAISEAKRRNGTDAPLEPSKRA